MDSRILTFLALQCLATINAEYLCIDDTFDNLGSSIIFKRKCVDEYNYLPFEFVDFEGTAYPQPPSGNSKILMWQSKRNSACLASDPMWVKDFKLTLETYVLYMDYTRCHIDAFMDGKFYSQLLPLNSPAWSNWTLSGDGEGWAEFRLECSITFPWETRYGINSVKLYSSSQDGCQPSIDEDDDSIIETTVITKNTKISSVDNGDKVCVVK